MVGDIFYSAAYTRQLGERSVCLRHATRHSAFGAGVCAPASGPGIYRETTPTRSRALAHVLPSCAGEITRQTKRNILKNSAYRDADIEER